MRFIPVCLALVGTPAFAADVLVGAPREGEDPWLGAVVVLHGSANGLAMGDTLYRFPTEALGM